LSVEFIEAPAFTRLLAEYLDDDQYRELQHHLARDPEAGDLIQGTGGFRKVRWADSRRGQGKRGGLRGRGCGPELEGETGPEGGGRGRATATLTSSRIAEEVDVAKGSKRQRVKKRRLFGELMAGVQAMREHRQGRLTLRTHQVEPIALPALEPETVRDTREALHMSRQVFAFKLGVNPRTLERWEQGRSKPNEQAAALIWLVRKYPDTLERLESLSGSA
jgi:putative transcriptional regulator